MEQSRTTSELIDEARHALCNRIVDLVQNGNQHIRIRQLMQTPQIWFYTRHNNRWKKQEGDIVNREMICIIDEQLQSLCSRPHTAHCEIREHSKPDWHDTDIRFDADILEEHSANLASYLFGLLFYDHRDSGQDRRQQIRRGSRFGKGK